MEVQHEKESDSNSFFSVLDNNVYIMCTIFQEQRERLFENFSKIIQ